MPKKFIAAKWGRKKKQKKEHSVSRGEEIEKLKFNEIS
jgi:hypothetical protein